jgi:hypothetical protein
MKGQTVTVQTQTTMADSWLSKNVGGCRWARTSVLNLYQATLTGRSASPVVGKSRIVRQSKDGLAGWYQPVIPTGISSFMLPVQPIDGSIAIAAAVDFRNTNALSITS